MKKITKIEPQKRKGRFNIYLNDQFGFGISEAILADYGLGVGMELSEEDIERCKNGETKRKCTEKAYDLLSIRPRSERELRDKLKERFEEEEIEACITKMKDYGYINDTEFTKKWVEERKSQKGKRALFFELSKKGVEKGIIESSLESLDEKEEYKSALTLVGSKSKFNNLSRQEAYIKIGGFLSRRGFSYDVTRKVINSLYEK